MIMIISVLTRHYLARHLLEKHHTYGHGMGRHLSQSTGKQKNGLPDVLVAD